uniref:Uncharacterized protein n=1 Tax=Candidatus Kentrum sp. UNK TaxID=2126344 RepID=A0A451AQC8_9GAMM|nr:MAG: hypothetical protein BECKUNK1418G_GA0071005_10021 [Candidatus Kentron sp. UNK]VFK68236.1 MAG: hypothetical protein BECKUNK1418H_GA0071006_10011 [Candidatus Kentron sp. UNK]
MHFFISNCTIHTKTWQRQMFCRVCIAIVGCFVVLMFPIQTLGESHVAIIVDTSVSMREAGMDPKRSSLLVTRLFSDIVPGQLSVIKLIELSEHEMDLPSRKTADTKPCDDDASRSCSIIEPVGDWGAVMREKKLGALHRSYQGDKHFKQKLEEHLQQDKVNSQVSLAMIAAEGALFGAAPQSHCPTEKCSLIWLTDGKVGNVAAAKQVIAELRRRGAHMEAIVFGQGDPTLPRSKLSIQKTHQVSSPAEMMRAFAGVFRRIVDAPYEIDGLVSQRPRFRIEPNVDEAWVVVYGDASLTDAWLDGPSGRVATDYATDRWKPAGAYRVAHLERPRAGEWRVGVTGGGSDAAYAVIQRASLFPVYLGPRNAMVDIPITVVAGLVSASDGPPISDPKLLDEVVMRFEWNGNKPIPLRDDGVFPDVAAGDGRFSGQAVFNNSGIINASVRARSRLFGKTTPVGIQVAGTFKHRGPEPHVDLGEMGLSQKQCKEFVIDADQRGDVPLELVSLKRLPSGHELFLRIDDLRLGVEEDRIPVRANARFKVCLQTSARAAASVFKDRPLLRLRVPDSEKPGHAVTIHLSWVVQGLSFLQRWIEWILTGIAVMTIAFIALGFIVPHRFPRGLAVSFGPEWDDILDLQPQPVTQWKGTGIGFYRHARAYLHLDYRLSGRAAGALAVIRATSSGVMVATTGGALYRSSVSGDWDEVYGDGIRFSSGDVFRIGETGPFFSVSIRL